MKYFDFLIKDIFKHKILYIFTVVMFFLTTIIYLATIYSFMVTNYNNNNVIKSKFLSYFYTDYDINDNDRDELLKYVNKPLRNSYIFHQDKCILTLMGDYNIKDNDYRKYEKFELKILNKKLNKVRSNSMFEDNYLDFEDCESIELFKYDENTIRFIGKVNFIRIILNLKADKNDMEIIDENPFNYIHLNIIKNFKQHYSYYDYSLALIMILIFIYNIMLLKVLFKYFIVKKFNEFKINIFYGETLKGISFRLFLYIFSMCVFINVISFLFYNRNIILSNIILNLQLLILYIVILREFFKYYFIIGDKHD